MVNPKYQPLFEPIELRSGIKLDNRLVMAPMTHFASQEQGEVSEEELAYYAKRIQGLGMVITACSNVTADGKGFYGEPGADRDELIPGLRRLADTIRESGAKSVIQLIHGGRLAIPELVPGGEVVAPSPVPAEHDGAPQPRELTHDEILNIIHAFGEGTRRAIEAGFDGVELHGANGYLLQQFFSPHANRRTDRWGGEVQERLSFAEAVIEEVMSCVKQHAKRPFLVGYRFSPEEPETPGITMEETLHLVDFLAEKELDYIHVSLNEFDSKPRRGAEATRSRLDWIVKQAAGRVPVVGVGSLHTADEVLQARQTVPLVALGRELIMEPDWVRKVKEGNEESIMTVIHKPSREKLAIPDKLWDAIIHTPGWFPVED
ncbi:NADH-dependent flavin oxidoreductase [Paenibacillus sp. CAA11]|uniref:NADH-dependent flavin oxidoreductase n=1 Tax=Paenibacillus sp. CAA11 TaxID=1532905 RepID=UPI000D36743B|nr:NADH-dependent flavin oxidoreductase [Paenibacillus sp. CAA11]AWB45231.1 NADH-dependent flavin oxidoreductase [Paenibacillus sp. CAA11]